MRTIPIVRYNSLAERYNSTRRHNYASYQASAITIHGMLSRGVWQKQVSLTLHDEMIAHVPFDYGWTVLKPIIPVLSINRMIDDVVRAYEVAVARSTNVGVIAHSFGTRIIAQVMQAVPEVQFSNIILTGSVLPRDFNWEELASRYQVERILNECSPKDKIRSVAFKCLGYGSSGNDGFVECPSGIVHNVSMPYKGHSRSMEPLHAREVWVPFLLGL